MVTPEEIGAGLLSLFHLFLLPLTWLSLTPTAFLLSVLALGPLPRHVAFIMDGNRRWARSLNSRIEAKQQQQERQGSAEGQKTPSGHQSGFQALKRVLDLCLQLKAIEHVTVYAFAIDNFKRKAEEVDELMALARSSLIELAGHGELLARHQARLRVVGRVHLLPPDVQEAVRRVEDLTRDNKGPTLNICIPYSSRDEMAGAVRSRVEAKMRAQRPQANGHCHSPNEAEEEDDDAAMATELEALDKEMLLAHSPPVDVMVRTSGVHRLSDFMLWQITPSTTMHFVPTYWPVFGMRDMLPILLDWQAHQFRKWLWGMDGGVLPNTSSC
ncbi:Undecaprenyl diphosphate synthase [Microstroma glucosiphilum]|uniref:Alkyl transferase n=1 Tax=Pseudomicrostroma glucosiphilum TaxID=1684307 RepID=A0A316U0U2_9BASI|nr:Undecaprenyl diphosphate synthase [Pseudomicrostroma glucosiphilum]PWN18917.1 Undecaprenyl diphosphate synthase [Pseudomicrostroma glucosiphilum]